MTFYEQPCSNGGVIIVFGEPKSFSSSIQRVQILDPKVAKLILNSPQMEELLIKLLPILEKDYYLAEANEIKELLKKTK